MLPFAWMVVLWHLSWQNVHCFGGDAHAKQYHLLSLLCSRYLCIISMHNTLTADCSSQSHLFTFVFLVICFYYASITPLVLEAFCFRAVRLCVHTWSYAGSLFKQWSEFHQIYNFGAVGDKDELIRVWDKKVKGQGHCETTYGQWSHTEHFGSHFLTCLLNAWTYFNKTYYKNSLSGPHDNDDISRSWVQSSRSQSTFSENALVHWRNTEWRFSVKDHLVSCMPFWWAFQMLPAWWASCARVHFAYWIMALLNGLTVSKDSLYNNTMKTWCC